MRTSCMRMCTIEIEFSPDTSYIIIKLVKSEGKPWILWRHWTCVRKMKFQHAKFEIFKLRQISVARNQNLSQKLSNCILGFMDLVKSLAGNISLLRLLWYLIWVSSYRLQSRQHGTCHQFSRTVNLKDAANPFLRSKALAMMTSFWLLFPIITLSISLWIIACWQGYRVPLYIVGYGVSSWSTETT